MNRKNHSGLDELFLSDSGVVLEPGILYLGATFEIIGSTKYVITLLGRSSIGRLGLFLNVTADLGHTGSISRWTLEMKVVQPLRIYPLMRIGQVAFWFQTGDVGQYSGKYQGDLQPFPNKDNNLKTGVEGID
jgi:dCTP deaminase